MTYNLKKDKEEQEQREIEEFIENKRERRKMLVKNVLIVIVCLGLVLAFCLPSLTMLL